MIREQDGSGGVFETQPVGRGHPEAGYHSWGPQGSGMTWKGFFF